VSDVERVDEARQDGGRGSVLTSVTNAMVALHKEQFGRGPVRARTAWADDATLVCTMHGAMLPAEVALTEMGHATQVQGSRVFFQSATRDKFIGAVEELTGRNVRAFSSAIDPAAETVWEIFEFHPQGLRPTSS
jgi:uncharacterized protein YbcI